MCLELWNKEDLGPESTTGEDRSIELTQRRLKGDKTVFKCLKWTAAEKMK